MPTARLNRVLDLINETAPETCARENSLTWPGWIRIISVSSSSKAQARLPIHTFCSAARSEFKHYLRNPKLTVATVGGATGVRESEPFHEGVPAAGWGHTGAIPYLRAHVNAKAPHSRVISSLSRKYGSTIPRSLEGQRKRQTWALGKDAECHRN